ncbi:uncharacterized protein LOC124134637 [Haliotis rufescens]|uniref:uncharacterized protein LOC124134637 n=1 Tax=Haliotis rufescens TaxID=6454 RepID=UPI00201E976C|nr:uncharacterized protein LOC124134637 [Haliotis rufescens]
MGDQDFFRFGKGEDIQHLWYLTYLMVTVMALFLSYIGLLVLQFIISKRYRRRRTLGIPRRAPVMSEDDCISLQDLSDMEGCVTREEGRESMFLDNGRKSRKRKGMCPDNNHPIEEQDRAYMNEVSRENAIQADMSIGIDFSSRSSGNGVSGELAVSDGRRLKKGSWENNYIYVGHDLREQSDTLF